MRAVLSKEITSFFASPIAYLIIGIFLVLNGLFLWVFKGDYNILDYGYADLSNFFLLAPWILILLIPAIGMKSFSEETRTGTLELLYISPTKLWQIVMAKYLAVVILAVLAILPTMLYLMGISELGVTEGNLDIGQALGSYLGLLFLVLVYASISVFASSTTDNQIVAFITSVALCFLMFYISEALATLVEDARQSLFLSNLGLKSRFETMARGILDTRDLVYFLSITVFFHFATVKQLKFRKR